MLLPLSLYVHLPWCERKCPYCDFNSHERTAIPEAEYVEALLNDFARETAGETRTIQTVFVGGGTPSLFSAEAINRLLCGLREQAEFAQDCEITLEANPGSTDNGKLSGFVEAGVTRFSLGIQSFNNDHLKALGRIHDSDTAEHAIGAALASGAKTFNVDLMHGLPGQSQTQGVSDVSTAIEIGAPHVSWYQLTIEKNTRFYTSPPTLPTEDTLASIEAEGVSRLLSAGYRRYEVSAWSKPGQECRHNLNYWRFGDYLGIGAGAHGKVTSDKGVIGRYSKTRKPEDYLASAGTTRRGWRELDKGDRVGEFMLGALRLTDGFSLDIFEERTGVSATALEVPFEDLEGRGLLSRDSELVRTTELGSRYLDDVINAFFDMAGR
ncbi:MAG: radical SAM family heme chaperone HemW [Pseudomonadota bacterium]